MDKIKLPNRILFTGAPGSKWSSIAQNIELLPGFNTTDRTPERAYMHEAYSGHIGAYFGEGMELESNCSKEYTDTAYTDPSAGTMVVKSHDWALSLKGTKIYGCDKTGDWLMLVYRPNDICVEWWQRAGGFDIKYPNYTAYEDNARMAFLIRKQNENMLTFAYDNDLVWESYTPEWLEKHFGVCTSTPILKDVLVTIYKP